MQLDKFKDRSKPIVIEIDGEELKLTVRPYVMTPERERVLASADPVERFDELLAYFIEYVESWDLEISEGEPCPLTADAVAENVPSALMLWIMQEAQAASNPLGPTSPRKRGR